MEENSSLPHADMDKLAAGHSIQDVMGPLMVDKAIRQAIQYCWMALSEEERTPAKVEQEILRLVRRALRDMKQDAVAFGLARGNAMSERAKRLSQIRSKHPRAYEKWAEDEDNRLKQKFNEGASVEDLATFLQRQPSAVRSRLMKLGLISETEARG